MLTNCPMPQGRDKAPLTKDERKSIAEKMRNVVAERRAYFDAANELDDAKFNKRQVEAQNRVVQAQKRVDAVEAKIEALTAGETVNKALRDKMALFKAEQESYKKSVKAQQNLEAAIADLDARFFKANPEITPQMAKAYESVFMSMKNTTDPAVLKSLESSLKQLERGIDSQVRGGAKLIEDLWKNREVQLRNYKQQLEVTRVAGNRVKRAHKKLVDEANLTDKGLAKELSAAQKDLDGKKTFKDALDSVAAKYNERLKKAKADLFESKAIRDEYISKLTEAITVDPRKGRGVLDWVVSRFGYTLDGIKSMEPAIRVRLSLQEAASLAENMVNKISDVIEVKTLIDFTKDFAKAADSLGLSVNRRKELMVDTIEKGQIPSLLNFFDTGNPIITQVQRKRYDTYHAAMLDAGFTPQQIDEFINRAVRVSEIANDIRNMSNAFGVTIDTIEPFIGYMTRIFSLDGRLFVNDVVNIAEKKGSILPVGKDTKFQFDISRKYDFLVPTDIELGVDILKVSRDELLALIENPLQMKLFIEKNLTFEQIDSLVTAGFFQKLPMSTTDVYDYLMAQYRLPFSSAADMFNLDIVDNLKTYSRAIGDQANISMMLNKILNEDGVKLGWSVPLSVIEQDKLLPASQRQFANYVKMEEKMLEWTARLGLPEEVQKKLGDIAMHPVVADQVIAILDITKSPALLGQLGGAVGWFNKLFSTLTSGTLVANAPVYVLNQIRGNYLQLHAAGANVLHWMPAAQDLWRVVRGEGLDHLDNTIKRYSIDGKQMTERDLFMWLYDNHGTATTGMYGERGKPSAFKVKDAARNLLSNSSAFIHHLMQYTFGTGELTGGKTLNSMERVARGVEYFTQHASKLLNDMSAPVFYTANMVDMSAKYATLRSVAKRIDGTSAFDKTMTYMFSQSYKQFDTAEAINKHLRAYFPDMRDVGSTTYGISKYGIMFFSWQASMMPRVLRDVVRRPWRYAAYEKIRQFTTDPLRDDESVTEAGLTPDLIKGMPYYIGKGSDGKLIFWMDSSYNPTTQAFEFLKSATTGDTTADRRAKLQGDFRNQALVNLMKSTYAPAKIIYELTSNTNLGTGKALRRTDGRGIPLLGFEVPPELYSVINNAVPYAGALDRLDIAALSGVPEIRDNSGNIIQQGRAGLGGVVPSASGRVLRNREIENNWAYRLLGTIGGNMRVVDLVKNNQATYNDVYRSLDTVTKQFNTEKDKLLTDKRVGSIRDTRSYDQRVGNLEKLLAAKIQLQIDLDRVYLYLRERGELTDLEIKQRDKLLNDIQLNGDFPIDTEKYAKELLRFRQEWSIPRYDNKEKSTQ